ncbi:MAG: ABC transporter substrate-binding protein [Pseudomonadota bacterium]
MLAIGPALASDRLVVDDAGRKVQVPQAPKRIVVLHEAALGVPIAELGIAPVGSYGRDDQGASLLTVDFYKIVLAGSAPKPLPRGIGAIGNMDLERLRALSPDLIIGTEHNVDRARQLSKIAPVYLQNSSTGRVRGNESQEALSRLLKRTKEFTALKRSYAQRVKTVRDALPHNPNGKTYLGIFITDQINLIGEMSGLVQAFQDLGYTRLDVSGIGAIKGFGSALLVPISPEVFASLNPDLLVMMNSYGKPQREEAHIRQNLDRIIPGWARFLKPARDGRIIFLDSAKVTTPSFASANHTLDAVRAWASHQK